MATIRRRNRNYKWEAQVRVTGYKKIYKSFKYKEHAKKWAKEIERKIEKGIYQETGDLGIIKLGDLLKRYLKEVSPNKKSYPKEKFTLAQLMRDPISSLTINELTSFKLNEFRKKKLNKITPSTVNRIMSLISSTLTKAQEEWNLNLPFNPARNLKRLKENKSRERRLSVTEYNKLMEACSQSSCLWLKSLVILAIETAMRRGELLSLTRDTINLEKKMGFLNETKNGSSRTVPLTEKAIQTIQSLPISFDKKLFPIGKYAFRFHWRKAMKQANIKDFRFHDLRHEAISRFFEKGLSIPEVALISGHKDVRMLFRYTHLKAEDILKKL